MVTLVIDKKKLTYVYRKPSSMTQQKEYQPKKLSSTPTLMTLTNPLYQPASKVYVESVFKGRLYKYYSLSLRSSALYARLVVVILLNTFLYLCFFQCIQSNAASCSDCSYICSYLWIVILSTDLYILFETDIYCWISKFCKVYVCQFLTRYSKFAPLFSSKWGSSRKQNIKSQPKVLERG